MSKLTNNAGQFKDEVDGTAVIVADNIDPDQVTELWLMERGPDVRYPGLWENPGGSLEPGETPEDTALRELWEELGAWPAEMRLLFSHQPIPGQAKQDHIFLAVLDREPRMIEPGKCVALHRLKRTLLWTVESNLTDFAKYDFRRLGWLKSAARIQTDEHEN